MCIRDRSTTDPDNAFWVYRSDGNLHGLDLSTNVTLAPAPAAVAQAPYARCLLTTVPGPGETCCNATYSYPACPAAPPARTPLLWLGALLLGSALLVAALACLFRQVRLSHRAIRRDERASRLLARGAGASDAVSAPCAPAREQLPAPSLEPRALPAPADPNESDDAGCPGTAMSQLPVWDVYYVCDVALDEDGAPLETPVESIDAVDAAAEASEALGHTSEARHSPRGSAEGAVAPPAAAPPDGDAARLREQLSTGIPWRVDHEVEEHQHEARRAADATD